MYSQNLSSSKTPKKQKYTQEIKTSAAKSICRGLFVIGRFVARPTPTHYRWTPLMFVDASSMGLLNVFDDSDKYSNSYL